MRRILKDSFQKVRALRTRELREVTASLFFLTISYLYISGIFDCCIVYYDELNAPTTRKSGTKIALDYAVKKDKQIIVLPIKCVTVCFVYCLINYSPSTVSSISFIYGLAKGYDLAVEFKYVYFPMLLLGIPFWALGCFISKKRLTN